jgi:hypothetical protein
LSKPGSSRVSLGTEVRAWVKGWRELGQRDQGAPRHEWVPLPPEKMQRSSTNG